MSSRHPDAEALAERFREETQQRLPDGLTARTEVVQGSFGRLINVAVFDDTMEPTGNWRDRVLHQVRDVDVLQVGNDQAAIVRLAAHLAELAIQERDRRQVPEESA